MLVQDPWCILKCQIPKQVFFYSFRKPFSLTWRSLTTFPILQRTVRQHRQQHLRRRQRHWRQAALAAAVTKSRARPFQRASSTSSLWGQQRRCRPRLILCWGFILKAEAKRTPTRRRRKSPSWRIGMNLGIRKLVNTTPDHRQCPTGGWRMEWAELRGRTNSIESMATCKNYQFWCWITALGS